MLDSFAQPSLLATWQLIILLAALFVLMFKRWFWFVTLTLGSMATSVEALASIMQFNLTRTFGYALLAAICWAFAISIADGSMHSRKFVQAKHIAPTDPNHPDWSPD